ncbi:MAG: hypothetical protein IJ498_00430 [Akkermansia sp.]|nr:hypothetical protein [Akkermansia sp.]
MKYLLPLLALALSCCTAASHSPQGKRQTTANRSTNSIDVTDLGRRIWANECAGSVQGLVSWNTGEAFPSLGIGHFIWYPAGIQEAFDESFPKLVVYARSQGVRVPTFFNGPAPWPTRAAFAADRSGKADAMRRWLAANVELQTRFIILRSRAALPAMARASAAPRAVIARYKALAATTQGMYCLVDYVNFKGEGLKPEERYKGQGWGLLQVLEEMQGFPQGRAATAEFSRAASAVMRRRVANSPAARGEQRWLQGWLNRCATYRLIL